MKNIYINCLATIFSVLISTGCDTDELVELNINKNAVTELDPSYLFTKATLSLNGEYEMTRALSIYSAPMIQHIASTASYFSGDKYYYSSQYSGAFMETQYDNVIRYYSNIISATADTDRVNLNGVSHILRAFDLHRMTDIYGDIPYTQAGYGLQDTENWFPTYQSQQEVYSAIVTDVKAGRDKLSASADDIGIQDVVYGGDISKWRKFANTLLMRVALRMSNVDAATAQAVFVEAYNNGGFSSNDDNGTIKHLSGPQDSNRNGLNNGLWNTYKYSKDCKISATFVDWMKANNDPRLMIVSGGTGDPEDSSTWNTNPEDQIGMPNGFTAATMVQDVSPLTAAQKATYETQSNKMFSMLNLKYLDWEDPYYLISYAEHELMAAEAILKGWISGDASAKFTMGVTAAIDAWTAFDAAFATSASDVSAYISSRGFDSASAADKLRLIGEEYWAATWLNDIESWSNWRRTGFPELTPTSDPNRYQGIDIIPRRLKYWENEISANPSNISAAISRMGADEFNTRVWWDGGN